MATRTKWGFAGACLIALGLAWGCGGSLGSKSGGESHFLIRCDDTCSGGLSCIAGVCTRGCVVGEDDCDDLHADAECTATIEPGQVAICDVACSNDADCDSVGANYTCDAGQCRAGSNLSTSGSGGSMSEGGSSGTSTSGSDTGGTASGSAANGGASSSGDTGEASNGSGGAGGATGDSCVFEDHELPDGAVFTLPTACEFCTCNDGSLTCEYGMDGPCSVGVPVFPCGAGMVSDPVDVLNAYYYGDSLQVGVSYSGGCEFHDFGLCYEAGLDASGGPEEPVKGQLRLYHDDNLDTCLDRTTSETLLFDLLPYAEYVRQELDVAGATVDTSSAFGLYAFGQLSCDQLWATIPALEHQAAEQTLSYECASDADCAIVPSDSCLPLRCGDLVMLPGQDNYLSALGDIDAAFCNQLVDQDCPIPEPPNCENPPGVACVEGRCTQLDP